MRIKRIFPIPLMFLLVMSSVVEAAEFFVSKAGSDSNGCSSVDSAGTNKLTVGAGLSCLSAGDTLTIHTGTYVERITTGTIPSGTVTAPTVVRGYTGETATLKPTAGGYVIVIDDRSYITLDNLDIDGSSIAVTTGCPGGLIWGQALAGSGGSHYLILQNSKIHGFAEAGSAITGSSEWDRTDHLSVLNTEIYSNTLTRTDCGGPAYSHGIYIKTPYFTAQHNYIHGINGWGVHLNNGQANSNNSTHNADISYNVIIACGVTGIRFAQGADSIAHHNLIVGCGTNSAGSGSASGVAISSSANNNAFYHNTIYNNVGPCIYLVGGTNAIFTNNICYSNTGGDFNTISGSYASQQTNRCTNAGTGCSTTGSPVFVNTAGADYNLGSGSTSINAGTDLSASCPSGMICSFAGSAPDQGALESPIKNSFSIDTATATFTWDNPFTPIVKVSNPTCRNNTVADNPSSCTTPAVGSNSFTCTLTTPVGPGDVVDCSFVVGAVRASQVLGNLASVTGEATNLALTNSVVTNLTGATTPVLTQTHQQIYQLVGGANTAAALLAFTGGNAEDASATLPSPSAFRIRSAIEDTVAAAPASGLECWISEDGGAYAQVPASTNGQCTGGAHFCMSPIPNLANFTPTTKRQTSAQAFLAGVIVQDHSATPNITWALNSEVEQECAVQVAPGVTPGTTFDLRMRTAGGVALSAYTQTVRVTVGPPLALLTSGAK